ncbi:MAG: acetamidase/formamidase family protein [Candidatus Bathyarchaeia archaeon]
MVRRIRRTSREEMSLTKNCTLGSMNEPIAKITPGETIEVETWDARGDVVRTGQVLEDAIQKGLKRYENPVTGPIYVENAEPGDALKIEIISIEIPEIGWTAVIPGFGGLEGWLQLSPPVTKFSQIIGEKIVYKLKDGRTVEIPAKPFIGTIGVSPKFEAVSTVTPGRHGGNMDVSDICVGSTLYLPVAVNGALFGLGDVHAVQGDGEICGTALEVSSKVTLKVELEKNKNLDWPRIESKDEIMTVCSAKPFEDAVRLAFLELIKWLETDYGFERYDAYMFLSLAAKGRIAQIVDPLFTFVAKIPKKMLPKGRSPK